MGVWQRKGKGKYYTTVQTECNGRKSRPVICTEQKDRGEAEAVERRILRLQSHCQLGRELSPELMTFVDRLPGKLRKRLIEIGLLAGELASLTKDVKSHVEDWLAASDFCSVHRANRRTELNAIIDYVGATRLSDLTPEQVTPFLVSLKEKGKSARTRNRHRQALIAFLSWCEDQGRIHFHHMKSLPRANEAKDRRRRRRSATEEELRQLIAVVPRGRRAKYLTAVYTGLRRNEIKRLLVGDVDFTTHQLRVPAEIDKENRDCVIPLHPELELALRDWIPQDASPSDRLFDSIPTRRTLNRDLERAGIRRTDERQAQLDFHALRRTMATRLLRADVTASHAKLLTRHANTTVLENHYNDLHTPDATAAMNRLDWIGPKPSETVAKCADKSAAQSAARRPLRLAQTGDMLPQPAPDAPTDLEICRVVHYLYNSPAGRDMREDAPIDIGILRKALSAHGFRAISAVG